MLDLRHHLRAALSAVLFVPALLVVTTELGSPARATVAEFYAGKTVTITVGTSPGGSYDYYARVFARAIGKYIPGNPNVVVQNMPGAGTLRAANFLYNVAPRDGTALAVLTPTVMLEGPLGTPGVQYNPVELSYIGRMSAVVEVMLGRTDAPAKNIYEARTHQLIAAGTGPTSPTEGYPRLLNAFAGTKFRIVSGYRGSADMMLGLERGEVDALEIAWSAVVRTKKHWLDAKKVHALVQAVLERSNELPDVPTLVELGTTPDGKAALAFYTSSAAVSRALLGTPGIPADRLKALRDAFQASTRDPELLADIKKSQAEFDPAPGEYLQDLAKKVAATPPDIVQRTAAALRAK
jgi:tripartite-type tricarboxylate transporter receptor subunit TctC